VDAFCKVEDVTLAAIEDMQKLAPFGVGNPKPRIAVKDANYENRGELLLEHTHDGVDLDPAYNAATIKNVFAIWSRPVHLETQVEERRLVISFDGQSFSERSL